MPGLVGRNGCSRVADDLELCRDADCRRGGTRCRLAVNATTTGETPPPLMISSLTLQAARTRPFWIAGHSLGAALATSPRTSRLASRDFGCKGSIRTARRGWGTLHSDVPLAFPFSGFGITPTSSRPCQSASSSATSARSSS